MELASVLGDNDPRTLRYFALCRIANAMADDVNKPQVFFTPTKVIIQSDLLIQVIETEETILMTFEEVMQWVLDNGNYPNKEALVDYLEKVSPQFNS
jgi:hypothetical protein